MKIDADEKRRREIEDAARLVKTVRQETGTAGWDFLVPRVQRAMIAERVLMVLLAADSGSVTVERGDRILRDALDFAGLGDA